MCCLALSYSTTKPITTTLTLNRAEAPLTRVIMLTLFKQCRLINTSVQGRVRFDSDSVLRDGMLREFSRSHNFPGLIENAARHIIDDMLQNDV